MLKRRLLLGHRIIFAIVGNNAAAHFWVEPHWNDHDKSWGGVEYHERPREGKVADHEQCWLLKAPCCHDGSSLIASETYIPLFHECCEEGNYEPIWHKLEAFLKYHRERELVEQ